MSGKGSEGALAAATTAGLGGLRPLVEAMPDGIVIADSVGRILYVNRLAEELSGYLSEQLIGLTVESLVPERFRAAHVERRAEYASSPHTRPMGSGLVLHLLHKDGTELPVDIALSPIETEVGVIIVTGIRVATDGAPRNADAHQRAVKAERRVAAGMEVTQAIIEGRDTTDVLKLIAARARDLVGAAFAAIASPEAGGDELLVRVTDGAQADEYRGSRLPVARSLTGQVFTTRQSVTVADAAGDARAYQSVLQLGNLGPALIVPLYVANRSIGAMIVANQRGGAAFTAEDLSVVESFAAQAAMRFEIATVRERLQRLTSVTIAGQKPLEDALAALAHTVVEATDTIACGIFLLDAERHLTIAGTDGLPEGFVGEMDLAFRQAGARLPQMDAIESRTLVVREGIISRFLAQPPSDPVWEPVHQLLRGVSWDTIVSVPLIHDGQVVGVLSGYYPKGYRLSDAEVAFLKVVADHAAAIAENARLFTNAQSQVAVEERQRLARELHDSVSQALFGIALGAQTAREHLEQNPAAARAPLDYVLQLAEAGMAEMRALIFELRPESLEQEGLNGALAKQAAALRARHGIQVDEVFDAEPTAPIAVKEALFRIAQEALNNTAKHAKASHVELRLTSAGEMLVAEIRDDGAGFDTGGQFPGHLGLQSMRERALRLGGNVEIISSTGRGTLVRATIPSRAGP
jgi:PAS domain S-box-containing protein